MTKYSYIHVCLRGEVQGATRTIYSYDPEGSGSDPEWNDTMVEPGAAIKRFLNANDCYVLQQSEAGHYISHITRNTLEPGKGYVMISMLIDNGCSLTGRQVYAALGNLRKVLVDENRHDDDAVEEALMQAEIPQEPVMLEAWRFTPADTDEEVAEAAYRTYITLQELESIFSFPGQPEYDAYRCVIIVSATTSLRPGVKMPRITVPIRKQYGVVCPEGVEASASLVYDGDRLTLVYSKEGFDTHEETVTVGNPSAYTKYEGSTIKVRTSAQTGIRFVRRVGVKVLSSKGMALNGYTISVNGQSVSTSEPFIEFTERDLKPGTEVEIQAASNNYRPLKITRSAEDMLVTDEIMLELQPVEQTVTLRLDFGDSRVLEQQITIEKSTAEYNRLHSGNFHGFRAHRQVTDDNSEIYNVDVRLINPPVAPNFDTARADAQGEGKKIAPVFENVSDEAVEERPRIDTKVPRKDDYVPESYDDAEDGYDDDDTIAASRKRRRMYCWLGAGVAVILLVVGLAIFIPDGDGRPQSAQVAETTINSGEEGPADVQAIQVAPMTPEEKADVDYLNGSAAWILSKLQSDMGRSLAEALTNGDLDALANNDYFAVKGRCTNEQANVLVDMAWRAIGSPNERGNSRKMRAAAVNGEVVLRDMVNSLAKVRPAENANERPRPQK